MKADKYKALSAEIERREAELAECKKANEGASIWEMSAYPSYLEGKIADMKIQLQELA